MFSAVDSYWQRIPAPACWGILHFHRSRGASQCSSPLCSFPTARLVLRQLVGFLVVWLLRPALEEEGEESADVPSVEQEGEELNVKENMSLIITWSGESIEFKADMCERNVRADNAAGAAMTPAILRKYDSDGRWIHWVMFLKGLFLLCTGMCVFVTDCVIHTVLNEPVAAAERQNSTRKFFDNTLTHTHSLWYSKAVMKYFCLRHS